MGNLELNSAHFATTMVTGFEVVASQLVSPRYSTVITFVPLGRTVGKVNIGVPPLPIVSASCGPSGCAAAPSTESKNRTAPEGVPAGPRIGLVGAPRTDTVKLVCVL